MYVYVWGWIVNKGRGGRVLGQSQMNERRRCSTDIEENHAQTSRTVLLMNIIKRFTLKYFGNSFLMLKESNVILLSCVYLFFLCH